MHLDECASDRAQEHGSPLKEFHHRQVDVASSLQQIQLMQTHSLVMSLNEDSLLRPFRLRAGLAAPGVELGGWYSSDGFCPCHSFGQWLSALARYVGITNDGPTKKKVHRLVEGFAETIEPSGNFYRDYPRARGYSYDLLAGGLIDAHRYTEAPRALEALKATTRAIAPYLPGKAVGHFHPLARGSGKNSYDHLYVIPEHQFIAWQEGGDSLHLQMAKDYLFDELFDPLSRGENALSNLHAYTHLNALCSAAKAYLVLGDEKYLRAARNGFMFISEQSYATGGHGPNETFLPIDENRETGKPAISNLFESLQKTSKSFETACSAYAFFKLARYLLRITKDSYYGDSIERLMYNTVLGVKAIRPDGMAFYYSSYSAGARKATLGTYYPKMGPEEVRWPCCAGSLPQVATDYGINVYLADDDGIYVNLYLPSTLRWERHGTSVSLIQAGDYPLGNRIEIKVEANAVCNFTLRLRIPAWAADATLNLNGKPTNTRLQPGTFAALNRDWHAGDQIDLELRRHLRLEPIDSHHADTAALVYGPMVLFAIADEVPKLPRGTWLSARQSAYAQPEWLVDAPGGAMRFVPWWEITDEAYCTYLPIADS